MKELEENLCHRRCLERSLSLLGLISLVFFFMNSVWVCSSWVVFFSSSPWFLVFLFLLRCFLGFIASLVVCFDLFRFSLVVLRRGRD